MTFIERCHQHHEAIEKWMKRHPFLALFLCIVPALALGVFMRTCPYVPMGFILAYFVYGTVAMVGDGIWKRRTGYYEKHRCKECGRFKEPEE